MATKFYFIVFALFFCINVNFAQSAGSEAQIERAKIQTEKYNDVLIAADAAALSEEQRAKIDALHVERIVAVQEYRKNGASDEAIKTKNLELNKKNMALVFADILTKEQRNAKKVKK